MRVLVIGGSVFLGRAVVDEALARGAEVTVFNRGRSGTAAPAGVEQVHGDRTAAADLDQLRGRVFDLVVDTCGYTPVDVRAAAELLAPTAGHYAFVSTISVHPNFSSSLTYDQDGVHDGDPDAASAPPELDAADAYGWLKVGCERAVRRAFGVDRCSILRAGLLAGPHDAEVARLPWWIGRVARGGEVLVPGAPDDPVALIDSRDIAQFALNGAAGTVEVPGPAGRDTRADLMDACRSATGADVQFTWVADDWLAGQDVAPWTEVPLWLPAADGPATFRPHADRAAAAGLTWRPLAETVADTWAWQRAARPNLPAALGLDPEREAGLLRAWHAR